MTVRLRELLLGFHSLRMGDAPVILHASLSAFGDVDGGADTVVTALTKTFPSLIAPAFTYKTMVTPRVGPPKNALLYGSGKDLNQMAEFFSPRMPVDRLIGTIPEKLRRHPQAKRSNHPILSFTGIQADPFLSAQELGNPLEPLGVLAEAGGWALLLGVNHTVNTSIHYAEKLAGRMTFLRWALTPKGVLACPGFPGCSAGFDVISEDLARYTRSVQIGKALVHAVPLKMLFRVVVNRIRQTPLALLCQQEDCDRCNEIKLAVTTAKQQSSEPGD